MPIAWTAAGAAGSAFARGAWEREHQNSARTGCRGSRYNGPIIVNHCARASLDFRPLTQTLMSTPAVRGRFFSLKRFVLLAAVVALGWATYEGMIRWRLSQLYGGFDRVAMLRNATEVTAWRLMPPAYWQSGLPVETEAPEEFQVVGDPVALSRGAAFELQQLLATPGSYRFSIAKECGPPDYGVKFSFISGGDEVDVYVCFKCRELAVTRGDGTNGKADFDPSGSRLIAIAQELFPGDAEIMALK